MLFFKWGFITKTPRMLALLLVLSLMAAITSSSSYGQSRPSEDSSVVEESVWRSQRPNLEDRLNPAQLPAEEIEKAITKGLLLADQNPIPPSIQLPTGPFEKATGLDDGSIYRVLGDGILKVSTADFDSKSGFYGVNKREVFVGKRSVSVTNIGCLSCHAGHLFGKDVIGLNNRLANVSKGRSLGQKAVGDGSLFAAVQHRFNDAELEVVEGYRERVADIRTTENHFPGLEPTVHTVIAAAVKGRDFPAKDYEAMEALAKPIPWWVTKYKTRWLHDGIVKNGSPILANLIATEMSYNSDVELVGKWINSSSDELDSLTTAVVRAEAPSYFDFFDDQTFDLDGAKRGDVVFHENCARCHGDYEKRWKETSVDGLGVAELARTTKVSYPQPTKILDVGTDSLRHEGGAFLEDFGRTNLLIRSNEIELSATGGYAPPPLEGVWASWPYLHNGSVPTLWALLQPSSERPKTFYVGRAVDKKTDFDRVRNGYPLNPPGKWKTPSRKYDTRESSKSNSGHDVGIFIDKDGKALITDQQKRDLILFLKTL